MRLALLTFLAMSLPAALSVEKKPKPELIDPTSRIGVVTRVFHPQERRNWRGDPVAALKAVVWYPAIDTAVETAQTVGAPGQALFEAGRAMPHAEFAPSLGGWPLVVLSHGTGGSAMQMAWLGTALARAGFIAVAVDHPGNNSNTGMTPEGAALWWERATDVSDAIDAMLADEEFGRRIDKRVIGAAGYSLGGYTVMELAGARTDVDAYFAKCKANDDSPVCHVREMRGLGTPEEILAAVRKTSGESLARSSESFRDPRVKAVFAIAPALGFVLTPESLHTIRVPVEMVVGDDDRTAPARENADYLRMNVRGARETVLPRVSHYTFLDTCTSLGVQALPQYCEDNAQREAVHAQVAAMAVQFFYRGLKLR